MQLCAKKEKFLRDLLFLALRTLGFGLFASSTLYLREGHLIAYCFRGFN